MIDEHPCLRCLWKSINCLEVLLFEIAFYMILKKLFGTLPSKEIKWFVINSRYFFFSYLAQFFFYFLNYCSGFCIRLFLDWKNECNEYATRWINITVFASFYMIGSFLGMRISLSILQKIIVLSLDFSSFLKKTSLADSKIWTHFLVWKYFSIYCEMSRFLWFLWMRKSNYSRSHLGQRLEQWRPFLFNRLRKSLMHELLLSEINELSDAHFVSFGGIYILFVDELEVFHEEFESIFVFDWFISTVELGFEILELCLEILNFFGAQARRGWVKE